MTTAQVSRIAPPPSVAAVLSALTEKSRIGQVDFSSRLTPEPEEAPETAQTTFVEARVEELPLVADLGREYEDDDVVSGLDEDPQDQEYEEPAEDEVPAAEVVSLQAVPVSEPVKARRRMAAKTAAKTVTKPKTRPHQPAPSAPVLEPEIVVEDAVAAPQQERSHLPAPRPAEPEADQFQPTGQTGLVLPEIDERPPSVEEIARLVVERMHDAELAMMRHLEAIEAEAARRAELLTAQAELDAELIRLNARREAHHILTQARQRAAQNAAVTREQRQVEELTESLTRFADVVDELRPAAPRPTHSGRTL